MKNLVAFTEQIYYGNFIFLCSVTLKAIDRIANLNVTNLIC